MAETWTLNMMIGISSTSWDFCLMSMLVLGGVAGRIFQPAVSVYYWTLRYQILLSDEASGGGMVGKSEVKYLALKDTLSSDQTRSKPCLTIYLHVI